MGFWYRLWGYLLPFPMWFAEFSQHWWNMATALALGDGVLALQGAT